METAVERSSDRLSLLTASGETLLERYKDYSIDYVTGLITLAKPLWPRDEQNNPVSLKVEFAPAEANRDSLAYGVGVGYEGDSFKVSAGAMSAGRGLELGAQAGYTSDDFSVTVGYNTRLADGKMQDSRYTLQAAGSLGALESQAQLSYSNNQLSGNGRLAYNLPTNGSMALEHHGNLSSQGVSNNRTDLLYEQHLGQFGVGAGLGYGWERAVLNGVVRGLYKSDNFDVSLTHAQPFSQAEQARSDVNASYQIDENLKLNGNLGYAWGNDLTGSLGLEQRLGDANLSLNYQLPTASGAGNRARFGVDVPLALSDTLSLNVNAGYEYNFNVGASQVALGTALRYQQDNLAASLGAEAALSAQGTKFSVRSGIAGQLSPDQNISADVNYQLAPSLTGRANLAYALKMQRLTLLTYHSLVNAKDNNILKGELAPTYYLQNDLQIRPSLAYRINFDDSLANLYQVSLGAVYYFDLAFSNILSSLSIGAHVFYVWQPGTGQSALGSSIELSAQIIDNLWLTLGYSFSGLPGANAMSQGGLYFGVNMMGSGQY
ncbi:MAG: hypothetical protein R2880_07085 [Deinococcales bacterium]